MYFEEMTLDRIGPKKVFRHYIQEWMQHRRLNQARTAERMDTDQATISKLLNGKLRMSDVWLFGFAEALDVDVADLFRDPKRPTQEELLAGLSDDDTRKVISMIEAFKRAG